MILFTHVAVLLLLAANSAVIAQVTGPGSFHDGISAPGVASDATQNTPGSLLASSNATATPAPPTSAPPGGQVVTYVDYHEAPGPSPGMYYYDYAAPSPGMTMPSPPMMITPNIPAPSPYNVAAEPPSTLNSTDLGIPLPPACLEFFQSDAFTAKSDACIADQLVRVCA